MYQKPTILVNSDLQEGVYAASGAAASCFSGSAVIDSTPQQNGSPYYELWLTGTHSGDHYSNGCQYIISFNQNVTFFDMDGEGTGSSNGSILTVNYDTSARAIKPSENVGHGRVRVTAGDNLEIIGVQMIETGAFNK